MKLVLPFALALIATQAEALKCLTSDPVRSFHAAMAADDSYIILSGTVSEAEVLIPVPPVNGEYPVPVWFIGHSLTPAGFTEPLEGPMTVQVTCAGQWCGHLTADTPMIAFARLLDGRYEIEADACATWVFPPDPLTVDLLTSCLRGAACVPADMVD